MPHECTNCGRVFPDGSKEMLSGCPDCGGNKFQFAPKAAAARGSSDPGDSGSDQSRSAPPSSGSTQTADAADSGSGSEATGSTGTPGASGARGDSRRSGEASRDWPSSKPSDGGITSSGSVESPSEPAESDEFTEWPDTARRPEDRSSPPEQQRSERSGITTDSSATEPDSPDGAGRPDPSSWSSFSDDEDTAQADARSEVVSTDDLPAEPATGHSSRSTGDLPPRTEDTRDRSADGSADAPRETDVQSESQPADDDAPPSHGRVVSEPSADRPSIEELRAELNEQFESIKILQPGQYELNLMELYNREEYIISLQEDGRYVIDVPESWRGDDSE